eukprot:TRINITY_DN2250_c2_g1_i3.p1 TRINITY_DN2250_c2_g1~~TRINITY_DN2250_c2_g1_i3.p1  ORF type:complete len:140 (+),score=43.48 TRINITY_DN2250_c2_g1_i3:314-733(+)
MYFSNHSVQIKGLVETIQYQSVDISPTEISAHILLNDVEISVNIEFDRNLGSLSLIVYFNNKTLFDLTGDLDKQFFCTLSQDFQDDENWNNFAKALDTTLDHKELFDIIMVVLPLRDSEFDDTLPDDVENYLKEQADSK